jgi:hypothetical protein
MKTVFPTWRYHKTLEPKLVRNREELESLGKEWADTPAAFEVKEMVQELAVEPIEEPATEIPGLIKTEKPIAKKVNKPKGK